MKQSLAEQILAVLTPEGLTWKELEHQIERDPSNISKVLRDLEKEGKAERVCLPSLTPIGRTVDHIGRPRMVWRLKV
jgi:DNA-binding MarR family transcriptional regulator